MQIQIQLFTLVQIRIQIPKTCGSGFATLSVLNILTLLFFVFFVRLATASHLLVGGGPDGEGDVAMEPREFLGRSVRPHPSVLG